MSCFAPSPLRPDTQALHRALDAALHVGLLRRWQAPLAGTAYLLGTSNGTLFLTAVGCVKWLPQAIRGCAPENANENPAWQRLLDRMETLASTCSEELWRST